MKIAIDRELGRRSLARFLRLGWHTVVPDALRWGWHLDAICAHLEAVSSGEIRDLVICVPPGMTKSLSVSAFWPSWDWIRTPGRRFLTATYGQILSDKNARLHRDIVGSEWYRARWPETQISKSDADQVRHFGTTAKGWRDSTSVGGAATGNHAHVLLGDDLAKAQDAAGRQYVDPSALQAANDFWFGTFYTRRADARTTARVMIAQRLHHEDTPGKCIEAGYVSLVLPMEFDPTRPCKTSVWWVNPATKTRERFGDPRAEKGELLDPVRFPREIVDLDKSPAGLGPLVFEAQAQQNPTPREGAIFKDAGRNRWTVIPARGVKIITVDCAFKDTKTSDFVAIQVWLRDGPHFYLLDRVCERLGLTGTIGAIVSMAERHPNAAIHVEDKANGPAVIEVLKGSIPGVHAWSPGTNSKIGRAEAVSHLFESGNVWLPPDERAPWIGEFLTTLGRFPLVKHDDDVDALSMALLILYVPAQSQWVAMVAAMKGGGRR